MTTNLNDPMRLIQAMRASGNPQQFVYTMMEQQAKVNPMCANLLSLVQAKKENEVESIARNVMKEKGLDFDKEFSNFKKLIGIR